MSKFVVALAGVIAGFILAHVASNTAEGRKFFAQGMATWESFLAGFKDSYRA